MSDARASMPAVAAGDRTGPPLLFLLLAGLCVATSGALLVVDEEGLRTHVAGYVAASVIAIVLVGLFRRFDLTRRLLPGYRPRPGASRAIPVLLLVAFAVSGVHVWAIATELAS